MFKQLAGASMFTFHDAGDDGRFELDGLSAGTYVLLARRPSGLASAPRAVKPGAGVEPDVGLQVTPGGQVRSGCPRRLRQILADGKDADFGLQGDATTRSLRPRPITIEVFREGGATESRDAFVSAGEVVEIDLR